jgi:hypothetical protein
MYLIQIEHPVPNFDGWKQAFDDDPLGRKRSGVARYRVYRPVSDPGFVAVDLEFATLDAAEAFVPRLREMWTGVEGTIMTDPRVRIVEVVESRET